MWKNRSDEHCSDDVLLAHLDGELYGLARLRTARHLRKCWECRAHLSELEHQAESLARVTERELVRQSGSTAEARSKFLAWREEFEQNTPPAPPQRTNSWRWSLAAVATCAALVLVFLPRPRQPGTAVPPASEVLQGVQSFQAGLRQKPGAMHQVLTVDVVQSRPVRRRSAGRVEIWSDRAGGRYASRWVDERKTLKYAVWNRPGQAPYVYAAAIRPAAAGSLFDPAVDGLTVEGVERSFFDWLRAQDWHAAADFSGTAGRDGSRLRVERLASGSFRLTASREGNLVRAEFVVEVEAGSFRPKLQVLRLETADRALELRVVSDHLEVVPVARVDAAVFEPDAPRVASLPVPPVPQREAQSVPPAPLPVEDIETKVLFAVHRMRACVGDNVQVSTAADGAIEVRAIVQNQQRRAELAEVLQQAGGTRVRAEIRILQNARPGPERSHPLLPADGVRVIDGLYREALALVRLAQRYGPEQVARLTPDERKMVETMKRDHVATLRSGSRIARAQVEPALAALAGTPAEVGSLPEPSSWTAAAEGIFRAVDQADTLIDVPPDVEPRQAASRLLSALAELEHRVKQLDGSSTASRH